MVSQLAEEKLNEGIQGLAGPRGSQIGPNRVPNPPRPDQLRPKLPFKESPPGGAVDGTFFPLLRKEGLYKGLLLLSGKYVGISRPSRCPARGYDVQILGISGV